VKQAVVGKKDEDRSKGGPYLVRLDHQDSCDMEQAEVEQLLRRKKSRESPKRSKGGG